MRRSPWKHRYKGALCGDLVTVGGGTGLVGGEGEVRWKESHRQEWAGLDWKSRSGLGDMRG